MDNDNIDITYKNKSVILVSIVVLLAIVFCASYFITDYFVKAKKEAVEDSNDDGKTVYNQSNKYIQDSTIITLKTGEMIDSEQTLAAIKHNNNITKEVTKDEVCNIMKKSGYELIEMMESKLLFARPKDYKVQPNVEPNKYFIGEKDEYLVVYKSDENGNLSIVREDAVFRRGRKVSDLPEIDQGKIRNFEFKYDTIEKAIEDITEFIS